MYREVLVYIATLAGLDRPYKESEGSYMDRIKVSTGTSFMVGGSIKKMKNWWFFLEFLYVIIAVHFM